MPEARAKPGRNDPCPCGSGHKFKRCCGLERAAPPPLPDPHKLGALLAPPPLLNPQKIGALLAPPPLPDPQKVGALLAPPPLLNPQKIGALLAPPPLLNPQSIGTLVALLEQQRLSEAELGARELLRLHPDAGMLWKILGVALMRQGKDALQALRRTTQLLPHDGEAHGNLGAALHDLGRWTESLASLQRALAINPRDVDALVDAAHATRALGRAQEAVALYQRALAINPRDVDALVAAADATRALGRAQEAVALYQRALELEPRRAEAHNNLGNAFVELSQYEAAVACYRRALDINPADVQILCNLGNALRDLGLRREAASVYGRAIELGPERAASHYLLGNVLFDLRSIDAAVASYARVLALEPRHAPAHVGLGIALRTQHRHAEAEASCRAALAIDPNHLEALSLLGELEADRGRFVEAEHWFRRAIAIDPEFSFAFASIATHRKMTVADTEWLAGAEALLHKRLPLGHEISLRYGLGKYYDDVGQYARAFAHYRAGNDLSKRQGSRYDGAKLTRRIDELVASCDDAFMRSSRIQGSTSELPVFIVGMPRSGTSLTEQILASHSAVFGAGEVAFWDAAFIAYQKAGQASQAGGMAAAANPIPGIARDYLDRLTASAGEAQRVVDKMPANFMYLGLIHAAFPHARIIHMRRHPWDTCLSIYFQNFFNRDPYANDLDHLAHYYAEYLRITDHWRRVLPAATMLEIPYEGLIVDQEGWTRRLLEFVGLPWDPNCLDFHRTERIVITASKWQVRQKMHAASVGRWRHYEPFLGPLRGLLDPSVGGDGP
jgi:tetratricopeptide (TPR) repeat protein